MQGVVGPVFISAGVLQGSLISVHQFPLPSPGGHQSDFRRQCVSGCSHYSTDSLFIPCLICLTICRSRNPRGLRVSEMTYQRKRCAKPRRQTQGQEAHSFARCQFPCGTSRDGTENDALSKSSFYKAVTLRLD